MATIRVYADTSFVASVYLDDSHSLGARAMLHSSLALWLTPLHYAEWSHVIAQYLFRGKIDAAQARDFRAAIAEDANAGIWHGVPLPEAVFETCADLARRYGAEFGTRTLDSLHVASALALRPDEFWTFDQRQANLARAVGLRTVIPPA